MNVLALDLATTMGWAYGPARSSTGRPRCGSKHLGSEMRGHGKIAAEFMTWMADFTKVNQVDALYIEREMRLGTRPQRHETVKLLMGLVLMAEGIGELRGFQIIRLVDAQAAKRHFLGAGRFSDAKDPITGKVTKARDIGKREVIHRCRMLGIDVQDDNAADAVAIWHYGASQHNPALSAAVTPLFAGSRS